MLFLIDRKYIIAHNTFDIITHNHSPTIRTILLLSL